MEDLAWETFKLRASGADFVPEGDLRSDRFMNTAEVMHKAVVSFGETANVQELWDEFGCTQPVPSQYTDAASVKTFLSAVATSGVPTMQKTCYGYTAGEQTTSTPVKLFSDTPASPCDAAAGAKLRQEHNIQVDPVKQAAQTKLFQLVVNAFKTINVPVIMTAGLLLGWKRECDFLAHDNDMDVAVMHRDLPEDFLEKLQAQGLSVMVRVAAEAKFSKVHDNIGLEFTINHAEAPNVWCDVFAWEEMPPASSADTSVALLSKPHQHHHHHHSSKDNSSSAVGQAPATTQTQVPATTQTLEVYQSLWYNDNHGHFWKCKEQFESLQKLQWHDVEVYIPYPPEMHLTTKYGADWNEIKETGWCVYCDCDQEPSHVAGRTPWQKQWQVS
jgi:hypothetical protein